MKMNIDVWKVLEVGGTLCTVTGTVLGIVTKNHNQKVQIDNAVAKAVAEALGSLKTDE